MPKRKSGLPSAKEQLELITASLDDDKAENIVVIDLQGKASFADFMVVATGRSDRQVGAMADHIIRKLKELGVGRIPAEGRQRGDWVLLDSGDVVVHLFKPETRSFYNIEKLWSVEPAETRIAERIA
ncbi:MAG: ribosome silencing factor [Rhodospirillaceae bacterium]|nr:ribosome silencing factor [Rhodospirillaceae bacterium]